MLNVKEFLKSQTIEYHVMLNLFQHPIFPEGEIPKSIDPESSSGPGSG